MYVCICNGLKDKQLSAVIDGAEAPSVSDVYRELGCKPRCGKCLQDVAAMIETSEIERGAGPAMKLAAE